MKQLVLTAVLILVPAAAEAAWTCSASKLKAFRYNGGAKAYIHLAPYGKGGWYAVRKAGATKATGRTKNGTRFTCRKK